jgi:hypothetical protein
MDSIVANARRYCHGRGIQLDEIGILGWGQDGTVWKTQVPTAVKVFHRKANYAVEKACYQRLEAMKLRSIGDVNLAQMICFDDELLVIELEIVTPPYLLDFGKAYIDQRSPYNQEQLLDYQNAVRELFGDDYPRVLKITRLLWNLCRIDYVDAKPANICFRNFDSD